MVLLLCQKSELQIASTGYTFIYQYIHEYINVAFIWGNFKYSDDNGVKNGVTNKLPVAFLSIDMRHDIFGV